MVSRDALGSQSLFSAALCAQALKEDPLSGTLFVFRSRSGKALRCLNYDGQGSGKGLSRATASSPMNQPFEELTRTWEEQEALLARIATQVSPED